jgi:hypothetical protein
VFRSTTRPRASVGERPNAVATLKRLNDELGRRRDARSGERQRRRLTNPVRSRSGDIRERWRAQACCYGWSQVVGGVWPGSDGLASPGLCVPEHVAEAGPRWSWSSSRGSGPAGSPRRRNGSTRGGAVARPVDSRGRVLVRRARAVSCSRCCSERRHRSGTGAATVRVLGQDRAGDRAPELPLRVPRVTSSAFRTGPDAQTRAAASCEASAWLRRSCALASGRQ